MIIDLNYRVDILKGIVSQNAEHPLYYDDQNAHRVNVSLYRGQEEINLSGLSCNGYVVFVKEGASIGPLTGEVSNNTCSVVLPHEAYQHPGAIRVEIKLLEGDSVTTVLMLTGHVSSGRGDRVIDITGSIVPSLDSLKATIEELEERIAEIVISDAAELGTKVSIISRGHGENLIALTDFTDILSGVTCVVDSENQTLTATCTQGTYCSVQTSSTWVQEHLIPGHTYRLHAKTERISGSPDIRVAFRGTQSSYAQIPIGGGIYYDNDVGGDGFIDLAIDQYVKRVILFITMGTSAAASVTFSDIWLIDVTDETVRYDTTKTAILDAGCHVDWGWVPGEQTATIAGVTAVRNGNRITLNGTTTGNAYFRMVSTLIGVSSQTAQQAVAGTVLMDGHEYEMIMRLVGGSAEYVGTNNTTNVISPYPRKSGTTENYASQYVSAGLPRGYYLRRFVGEGAGLSTWFYAAQQIQFTNAEYEISLYDKTATRIADYGTRLAIGADSRISGGYPASWYGYNAGKEYAGLTVSYIDGITKLSGTYWTNNASTMWSVSNGIQTLGGAINNSFVNPNAILKAGRNYKISAIILSGSVTGTAGTSSQPRMRYYTRVGDNNVRTTEFTSTLIADTTDATYPIVYDGYIQPSSDTQIGFGFWTRSGTVESSETYNDLTVAFLVEDVTRRVLPQTPSTDGTYTLKVTVTNGVPAFSWVS